MAEGTEPRPQPEVEDDIFADPVMRDALRDAQTAINGAASEAAERVKEARLEAEADPSTDEGPGAAGADPESVGNRNGDAHRQAFVDKPPSQWERADVQTWIESRRNTRARIVALHESIKLLRDTMRTIAGMHGWRSWKTESEGLQADLARAKDLDALRDSLNEKWQQLDDRGNLAEIENQGIIDQFMNLHDLLVAGERTIEGLRERASERESDTKGKVEATEVTRSIAEVRQYMQEWAQVFNAVAAHGGMDQLTQALDELSEKVRWVALDESQPKITIQLERLEHALADTAEENKDKRDDFVARRYRLLRGDIEKYKQVLAVANGVLSKLPESGQDQPKSDLPAGDAAPLGPGDPVPTVAGPVSDVETDKPLTREEKRLGELQSLANQFQDLYNEFMVEEDLRIRNRSRTREHGGAILFGDGVALGSSGREMHAYAGDDHKTAAVLRPVPRELSPSKDDRGRLVSTIHDLYGSFTLLNDPKKFEALATGRGAQGQRDFVVGRDELKDLLDRLEAQIRVVERLEGDETPMNVAAVEFEPMGEEDARAWWEGQTWAERCGRLRGDLIRFDTMVELFRTAGRMDDLAQAMHRLTREDQVFAEAGGSLRLDEVLRGVEEQLRAGKNNPEIAGPAANELLRGFIAYETILRSTERAWQNRRTRRVDDATAPATRAAAAPAKPTPNPEAKGEPQFESWADLGEAEQRKRIGELFATLRVWKQSFVSKMETALSDGMPDAAQRMVVINVQFPRALERALRESELRMVIDEKLRARMSDERREQVIGLLVNSAGKI